MKGGVAKTDMAKNWFINSNTKVLSFNVHLYVYNYIYPKTTLKLLLK